MNDMTIVYGDPIDINIKIDGIKFEELKIPSNIDIYKDGNHFLSFSNGKGFSIIKINETEEVFVDIAIGETESLFDVGLYSWNMKIKLLDETIYKELSGYINVVNGNTNRTERQVKPWDLLNDNSPKVSKKIKTRRLDICNGCPEYTLGICKKCGCVMALKTILEQARCPLDKW